MDIGHNPSNLTAIFNKASAKLSKKVKRNGATPTIKMMKKTQCHLTNDSSYTQNVIRKTHLGDQCGNYTKNLRSHPKRPP